MQRRLDQRPILAIGEKVLVENQVDGYIGAAT
jgi:hypothetical protein